MTDTQTLFDIPEPNFAKFEAQIAKLSKRSEKLIGQPIKPFVFGYDFKDIGGASIKVFQVMLTAETPKVDGWTFVARIDHSQEVGNLIRAVPNTGVTIPETYRTAKPHCDHCKVLRYRRDTFVLHNDQTDEFKQVGTTCLTDFFGHDPYKIAKLAELLGYAAETARGSGEYDEDGRDFGLTDRRYLDVETVLAHAALAVRQYGWTSAKAARENYDLTATRERVFDSLNRIRKGYRTEFDVPSDEDKALATAALEWAQGFCDNDNLNDYMHNVCVVARSQMIEARAVGIAASIIPTYKRETEKAAPRQTVQVADMTGILALFDKAKASKLKNPAIVLDTKDAAGKATTVRLSIAGPAAKFPGSVNVTSEGSFETRDWYGRVKLDGSFDGRSTAPAGLPQTLLAFAADPAGVAAAHGRKTGNCCFCNKKLKDARSTEVGYGKTCAANYDLPWGAKGGDEPPAKAPESPVEADEASVDAEVEIKVEAAPVASQEVQWDAAPSAIVTSFSTQEARLIEQALRQIGGEALAVWQRRQEVA